MKKIPLLSLLVFLISSLYAQIPQSFSYQAVARNSNGQLFASSNISVRVSIIDSAAGGSIAYQELHAVTTNQYGLFTIAIGNGTSPTGTFSSIAWSAGNKWAKIEVDTTGGSNFAFLGQFQLLSVPYALNSQSSNHHIIATSTSGDANGTTVLDTAIQSPPGASITITVPDSGTIVVQANTRMLLDHNSAGPGDFLVLGIENTLSGGGSDWWDAVVWSVPPSIPSYNQNTFTFTVRQVFTVPAAGTYTYYLFGYMGSGADSNDKFQLIRMTAEFY